MIQPERPLPPNGSTNLWSSIPTSIPELLHHLRQLPNGKGGQLQVVEAVFSRGAIHDRDFDPQDVLLAVAASTWTFVNDGDWEERTLRVLRLVMDGLRYKPR